MKKRILASLLSLCLLAGLLPTAALAIDEPATETFEELGQTIFQDTTWDEETTLGGNLTVNAGAILTIGAQVTISGDVTISGGGIIKRNTDYKAAMIVVPNGASLTLADITIDGGAQWSEDAQNYGISANKAAIEVTGELILNNAATIQNNARTVGTDENEWFKTATRYYAAGGGISVYEAGSLIMNDGAAVTNNSLSVSDRVNNVGSDATGGGIGFYRSSSFTMNGGTVSGNTTVSSGTARAMGGGIGVTTHNEAGLFEFTINGGEIKNNRSTNQGGGISLICDSNPNNGFLSASISDALIAENEVTKGGGGGVLLFSATLEMFSTTIFKNKASSDGGGIMLSNRSIATIIDSRIIENTAENASGGGIGVSGADAKVTMDDSKINQNTAHNGGGLYVKTGSAELKECTIKENNASNYGGGIYLETENAAATIEDCTIDSNRAETTGGGIAVWTNSKIDILNSTIVKNSASNGGGVSVYSNSTAKLVSGKIAHNKATATDGNGGGVFIYPTSNFELVDDPVVIENIKINDNTTADNNVYLLRDNSGNEGKITLVDSLRSGATIGVTTAMTPTQDAPKQITAAENGTNYYGTSAQYFIPDIRTSSEQYISQANSTGAYVELAATNDTYYSVILDLKNISSTNGAVPNVKNGETYSATITADEGYYLPNSLEGAGGATYTVTAWDSKDYSAQTATIEITSVTADTTITVTGIAKDVKVDPNTMTVTGTYGEVITEVNLAEKLDAEYYIATLSNSILKYYQVTNGSLPAGITVNKYTGILSGTPTEVTAPDGTQITVKLIANNRETASLTLTVIINKAAQTAPAAPTMSSNSSNSITLNTVENNANGAAAEYSKDGGSTWQSSPEFTGLTPGTSYTFAVRYAETENYAASPASDTASFSTTGGGSSGGNSSGGNSSGITTYPITVENTRHGDVDSDRTRASSGATVTLTVTPEEGYELDELTVTDRSGNAVKLTDKGNGKYTFTMPRSTVTVEATFVEIENEPALIFIDVPAGAYYYDAVYWAVEHGVTYGTSASTFSPDASCTRAQMVTFLWRAAGSPEPETAVNPFADVSASAYYYEAVLWAVENGITNGTSATTFSPDATVTRGQTVTFLWRNAGSPVVVGTSFEDVMADAYYATAVAWAAAEGITSGTSATTFSPDNACTRAQIVTFLYRDLAE